MKKLSAEMQGDSSKDIFSVLPLINFLLSLFIVFHHSFNVNVNWDAASECASMVAWIVERYCYNLSECAVPCFFFISAILFFRNFELNKEIYLKKLKTRFKSLVIPYLIFNTLGYFKHIVFHSISFNLIEYLQSMINSDTMPLWFLRELMIFVIIAPLIFYIIKNKVLMGSIIVIDLILICGGYVGYRSFMYWLPIYMAGALFSKVVMEKGQFNIMKRNDIKSCFIAVLIIIAWFLPNSTREMDILGNALFILFRILSVICFIIIIDVLINKRYQTLEFMKFSFFVYCVHFPIISLIQLIFDKVFQGCFLLIQYFLTVAITYIVCVGIGVFLKKFIKPVWIVLNGSR